MSILEFRELAAIFVTPNQLCKFSSLFSISGDAISDAWYEVLSVLHLMAMVCLPHANTLLLPRSYNDGYAPRVSEGTTTVKCKSKVLSSW
jgi:hypothetical protein